MPNWTADDMPDLAGTRALVTGANSGLGFETSRALARKGAHVIMACRNIEKARAAEERIRAEVPDACLDVMKLDLASQSLIHQFTEAFIRAYGELNILFNNAGVMAIPRRETTDGFEMQFGVNHLGHFALTGLLMPALLAAPGARIVTTSSLAHLTGTMHFDDINLERHYARYEAYGQSKLANLLFAFELQRRLTAAGLDALSLAAHPGYSDTDLQSNSAHASGSIVERIGYAIGNSLFAQSAARGALPQLYAGTAPDVTSGAYYGPRYFLFGPPVKVRASRRANDREAAARLWALSEEMTGVEYALPAPARTGQAVGVPV